MGVKKLVVVAVIAGTWMMCGAKANAQTTQPQANIQHVISSQDLDLLRKDLRSQKKQLSAANLKLTDAEATKFWPVYDQYTAEVVKINDTKYALIQDYADHWGTMTDDQALMFLRQWLDTDIATTQLRQKYVPIVHQVLNARSTATFFQLDRRISMMIDLQPASQIPLVQAQQSQ
jgi:outer membrane murein-binding lipoprotein Lpp